MTPTVALKLLVPLAFFGYAAVANISLVMTDTPLPGSDGVLRGAVTAEIDTLYRDNLPHKEPAIGIVGAVRYLALGEGRSGVVVGRDGHLFTAEEFRAPNPDTYAIALTQIEETAARLSALDVDLVLAPLPAKADVLRDQLATAGPSNQQEDLYRAFLGDLKDRGIAAVDTRPALVGHADPFLATDTHWTPDGARAVADHIATSGTVAMGSDSFVIEQAATRSITGDLVSYVTSDALARHVGLPPEAVVPYTATLASEDDGALLDLFGDAGGGTDLVGTSYSANPDWSFAEALKLALGRDVVNHAEEGRGPFAPMVAYLDRLDPAAPPETVLWELPVRYLTDPTLLPEVSP
ncbi:alginate O-acetyltransferase [Jannaschia pagri]|uniref:Alginate O-acetyltransferase n=1 Tax=Jannaschia pagri TaxID=2829797 RepID=A0ABQ4NMD5_9RHOB|nr:MULTISPECIES: hypothetical protein [unclassified Jannaschia]GIT91566.1 alginate O-acetyltransferase [Jannaschia sp. AI_61]GIT95400.1 alginate O-acetyltransferase [Jannaschia sp. AI_62]